MRRYLPGMFLIFLLAAGLATVLLAENVRAQETALLDINTATLSQLMALPGMGEAYARRVVAGRPYTAKNQLVTRGVLPASAYEQIKERIVAHRQKLLPSGI